MVKMFSPLYFSILLTAVCMTFVLYELLRRLSSRGQKTFILCLLLFGFSLHFLKLLILPYRNDPKAFRHSTFCNICAVSTLIFPFLFLSKSKWLKDYMFYLGLLGGGLALLYPTEIFRSPYLWDTVRFYVCHYLLIVCPLFMVIFGHHKLSYKRIPASVGLFLGVLVLIFINEMILIRVGLVPPRNWFDFDTRNTSFVFGPLSAFGKAGNILTALCPRFLRQVPQSGWISEFLIAAGGVQGQTFYFPVLWLVIPVWVYMPGILALLTLLSKHICVGERRN